MEWFFGIYSTAMCVAAFILLCGALKHLATARDCLKDAGESLAESQALLAEAESINERILGLGKPAQVHTSSRGSDSLAR